MKLIAIAALSSALLCAQAPPFTPETVIATIDGRKITAAELQAMMTVLGPQAQQNLATNPGAFMGQIGLMFKLTDMAEKDKLDQTSPFKEQLALQRMQILSNAQANAAHNNIQVSAGDVKKFYDSNRDRYSQVRVKVIYVPFSTTAAAGAKSLTEAEAKSKAEKLAADIRGGADFVQLVKEHSEDMESKAKDGDFATFRKSDKVPDEIKAAIFKLKPGEISDPVRQANGYYVFRAEETTSQPMEQVTEDIVTNVRQTRFDEWMRTTQRSVQVKIENEEFFKAAKPPAPAAAKR
jgi:parvulin-like peptidyl-prolyl isomerase